MAVTRAKFRTITRFKTQPMKVTISFKEVNSDFDVEYAERTHEGQESEDNIKYNWEDELEVAGDVTDL